MKLSEADFGKAENDARHRAKLLNNYSHALAGHLEAERLEPHAFFDAYKCNRHVWHMLRAEGGRLMFLLPRSNAGLWAQLQMLLSGVVPATRRRISAVAIEDVLANLSADNRCPVKLREYALRLQEKYLVQSAI